MFARFHPVLLPFELQLTATLRFPVERAAAHARFSSRAVVALHCVGSGGRIDMIVQRIDARVVASDVIGEHRGCAVAEVGMMA